MKLKIPNYIKNLQPYKSGNMVGKNISREQFKSFINLASNENPLGASPMAIEAIKNITNEIAIYPDTASSNLVEAIADYHQVDKQNIVCGHGSDSLIQYIFNAFSDIGDEILTADGTFIGAFVNANKLGRTLIRVPMINYAYDLDAILEKVNEKTAIVYLANPNNPTGTIIEKSKFLNFMSLVPDHVLVILDEAYSLYAVEHQEYFDGLDILKSDMNRKNLIILRTLSKITGLAGLRVGYAISNPEIIQIIYKVKLPFEPNTIAQIAASAGIADLDFIEKSVSENRKSLQILTNKFDELNVKYLKAFANFVMILLDSQEQAVKFVDMALDNEIVVRHLTSFGIPNGIRISTGTVEQSLKASKVFEKIMNEIK